MLAVDLIQTGQNIMKLRKECGMTVRDLQDIFGFGSANTIYKWQAGENLPKVDNLVVLAGLFGVTMDEIVAVKNI